MTAPTATLTATPYKLAFRHLARGRLGDLLLGDVRFGLATSAYTPADTDEWWATPAAAEAAGTGYVAGGVDLPNSTVDNDSSGRAVLACDPLLFPAAGFTARWGVVFVNTGDPNTSPLMSYVDLGTDISPAGQDLQLPFPSGVFRIAAMGTL